MKSLEQRENSRLHVGLTTVIDLVVLSLLWLLFSLPLVTLGAASTAAYYTAVKYIRRERGRLWPCFWGAFRGNFRQSTLAWLLCLGWLLVCALNARLFGDAMPLLALVSRLLLLPLLLTVPWLFPYISRFENTALGSVKFAVWLSVKHLGATLLLALELAGFALIAWLIPYLLPLLPGPMFLLRSLRVEPALRPLAASAADDNEDQWYNEG